MIRAALKNPYLVIVLVLMIVVVGGLVCLPRIPADLLPTFETSAAMIVTFYPGMPPEVMEQDIMSRLQRWTGQSSGIEHQEAKAMQGVCIVKDFFHEGVSQAEALSQVSMYAMSDMFYLPPGTIPPMVMPFDPTASVPLCLVTVSNPDMSEKELYEIAYKNLRNNLQSINGVIAPAVYGGKLRRILAYVDPEKLRAYNLSIMDVHAALREQNVLIPAGSAKIGEKEFYIITNSMPDKVAELNDAPIKMGAGGEPILFSDVGEVQDSSQIQTNKVRVNGRTLVYVPVYRQPGSNTIEIVDRIHGKLAEILDRLKDERKLADGSDDPIMKNLTLNVVMDQSVKVRESIKGLWIAGGLGAVFAGIVVFIGLRNLRATFIVVLTIPIAILTSLIGLYFTGNTINAMTLGGLALAVGILIDQAIVVIDNIERHMNMGKERMQACWEGTREVSGPLFVSTLTFIVVFFPVIFLSGLAKFLFTPLALSVLFAVVASYLMAIFFVPVAASKLLKKSKVEGPESSDGTHPTSDSRLIQAYRSLLMTALRWKWAVLGVSLVLFIGSLGLMSRTGRELFPPIDSGQFTIYVRAASGTNIDVMEQHILKIENVLAEVVGDPAPDNPDMTYPSTLERYDSNRDGKIDEAEAARARKNSHCRTLISNIGVLMDWPAAYTPNTGAMDAFMLVELDGKGNKSVFDYVKILRKKLNAEFPEIEFAFDTGGILTAALNMGEPSPIHLQVTGYTLKTAHKIANQLVETIEQIPGAVDVRIAQRMDYPMIRVEIDRIAAADRGITTEEVMKCLVSSTNSSINFDPAFWIDPRNGNHYFLGTQYFEENINSLDTLKQIPVKANEDGTMTYLQDVATFDTNEKGPNVINHRNITRVTDIFANVEPGYDLGSVVAAIEEKIADPNHPLQLSPVPDSRSAVAAYPLWIQNVLSAIGLNQPTKYTIGGAAFKGFTLDLHGEIRSMRDSFVDFSLGLLLSTFLVYLVMVAQFRSFLDPVIVMVAVPLGFIGVALILWLTGTRLSIQSFMGIIMMIGIVVEYTIVLMDFANHRLAEGASVRDAIIDAAVVRFRPILMTSLTTILALAPMAIGFAGSEADAPLARTIVGGVIAATVLPYFVVPCLYVIIKRPPKPSEELEPAWT
ncbi:MAG: efflux RND transporter permease subunit [Planctomycetes bacterium]|nr:efflux RND transporter permease subunit [Planctomycetota bacterium]